MDDLSDFLEETPAGFAAGAAAMAAEAGKAANLAGVMEELGYSCTASEAAFQDVLRQVG